MGGPRLVERELKKKRWSTKRNLDDQIKKGGQGKTRQTDKDKFCLRGKLRGVVGRELGRNSPREKKTKLV